MTAGYSVPKVGRVRQAWHSQSLFLRTMGTLGTVRSLVAWCAVTTREMADSLPHPVVAVQWLARLAACCHPGNYQSRPSREIPAIAGKVAQAPAAKRDGNYLRLDRPHVDRPQDGVSAPSNGRRTEHVAPRAKRPADRAAD